MRARPLKYIPLVLGLPASVIIGPHADAAELTIACPTIAETSETAGSRENSLLVAVEIPAELVGARIDRALIFVPLAENSSGHEQILRVSPSGKSWIASHSGVCYDGLEAIDSLSIVHFFNGVLGENSSLDVTDILSGWVNGTIENNGLIISGLRGLGKPMNLTRSLAELRTEPIMLTIWYTRRK